MGVEHPAFYMYVLTCADGTLYTGYTTDVDQRLKTHNAGQGAKYTRGRVPAELLLQVAFSTKKDAMSAEYRFKKLSRSKKEILVKKILAAAPNEAAALLLE